jgi:hypothetical protein
VGQGLLIIEDSRSHSDTHLSVEHLWTSGRPAVQTSTWQHTLTKRQTSMPPTGFEPAIPASERPYTHVLDHAVTGIDHYQWLPRKHRTSSGYMVTFWPECRSSYQELRFPWKSRNIPQPPVHQPTCSAFIINIPPHSTVYNVCGVNEHNNRYQVNARTFSKKITALLSASYVINMS